MRILIFLAATAVCLLPNFAEAASKKFGSEISLKESISLKSAVASFDSIKDKDILVQGSVAKVCQKKGCWMIIKTDAENVRVTFKDYKFFVPLDSAGDAVLMQGRLERKETSVKDQKHYLKDEGASGAEIAAVKEPKLEYSFVASGVELTEK